MKPDQIHVGDVYVNVPRPRHEWRVTRTREGSCELERIDKPAVLRFVPEADLRDPGLYRRKD